MLAGRATSWRAIVGGFAEAQRRRPGQGRRAAASRARRPHRHSQRLRHDARPRTGRDPGAASTTSLATADPTARAILSDCPVRIRPAETTVAAAFMRRIERTTMDDRQEDRQAAPSTARTYDLPVLSPTAGPDVVDIRKLYGQAGVFTYDPGFTSTAACESAITFIDGDEGRPAAPRLSRSTSWRRSRTISRSATCCSTANCRPASSSTTSSTA